MSVERRRQLIEKLQSVRKSKVICLWHSDRIADAPIGAMTTRLASDQQPIICEHLRRLGHNPRLDLVLYTRGGDTTMPWPLVNLFRMYSDHFAVLVPFRAHSAGTLICLGADEIVMTSLGELSPIDPTTANAFNPRDKTNPQNILGISVEDITAFIELARSRVDMKGREANTAILEALTKEISPVALGNVNRVLSHIRMVGKKLLGLRRAQGEQNAKVDKIINKLTTEMYSHAHFINRSEAREEIGLNVVDATSEEEDILLGLHREYAEALQLNTQFKLRGFLGNSPQSILEVEGAFIESMVAAHVFKGKYVLQQRTDLSKLHPQLASQLITQQGQAPLILGAPVAVEIIPIEESWHEQK